MKSKLAAAILLVLGLTLVGCGSSNNKAGTINGNWTATLMNTNGAQVFAFNTSLTEVGNGSLTITNFGFSTNSPCFVSGETESGSFSLTGDFNGNVSGGFGLNVHSGSPGGNTLTLSGTVSGNTVTGTWSLIGGVGCTGTGSFTMTRM
ncbi:MAG: hypothetical protein WA628_09360 [Terriglobales bacterium]